MVKRVQHLAMEMHTGAVRTGDHGWLTMIGLERLLRNDLV